MGKLVRLRLQQLSLDFASSAVTLSSAMRTKSKTSLRFQYSGSSSDEITVHSEAELKSLSHQILAHFSRRNFICPQLQGKVTTGVKRSCDNQLSKMGCLPFPSDYKKKRRFLTLIKHDDSDAHEKADFSEAKVDEPEITPHTQDSGFQESESVCDVSVVSLSSSSDEDEEEAVGDKLTCSLCDQVFGSAELLSQHAIVHEVNNTPSPFVSNIEDSIYEKILAEEADRDAS